ncbi:MAG: InlB B-repeat-containing protein [Firmicutes bacterium]|nr:InlB B-repeat-containing protein [Bacillota bacterium]
MRQKGRILWVIISVLLMMLILGTLALADDYTNHWSAQYITDAASRGWILGDGKGNYRPEADITRGEFAVMLWRALGQRESSITCPFIDVQENAFYYKAVIALFESEIVKGMSNVAYGPNIALTREMGFAMMARAYDLIATDANAYQRFADAAQISAWAREAIAALVEKSFISGVGNNKIAPLQQLKRGEMAKLLTVIHSSAQEIQQEESPGLVENVSSLRIFLSQRTDTAAKESIITITATSTGTVDFIGWTKARQDDTFKDSLGFNKIAASGGVYQYTINNLEENYGWYAFCANDNEHNFAYRLIEVKKGGVVAPATYTVTFNLNGGSGVFAAETVQYGERVSQPTKIPTREGYEFAGWHTDPIKKTPYNFGSAVFRNLDLYAHWAAKGNYVVFFMLNDGLGGNLEPQIIISGGKVSQPIPDPTRGVGLEFIGWYDGYGKKWDFTLDPVTKSMTLYAWWEGEEEDDETPLIVTGSLPVGTVGEYYERTLQSGAGSFITWHVENGFLPEGISLDEASGRISGTPIAAGFYEFIIMAENEAGSDIKVFSITINEAEVEIYYRISVHAQDGGLVSGGGNYREGAEVTVTALAHDDYDFIAWLEDGAPVSDEPTYSFYAYSNRDLLAQFVYRQ